MSFRILDQSPVFFDLRGNIAAGGHLEFYEAGTTTPKDVYGDQALSVNNGSTIAIGSDGRTVDDIWGNGSYRQRVYAADNTLISDDDDVEIPGGTGQVIPTLADGQFISSMGGVLVATNVLQPPDPTGQGGKIVGSDGANLVYVDKPADGAGANVSVSSTKVTVGSDTGDLFMVQSGTAQAPASGINTTTKAVTYNTPFKTVMGVMVTPTSTNITSAGFNPISVVAASSTTGFTVQFDINEASGSFNIVNPVSFQWVAFGTVAA